MSSPRVATLSAGLKLAVFAVVTLAATGLLATTIGAFAGGNTVSYRARFSDVTGVQPGDDVRIAGVRVGRVEDVKVAGDGHAEVGFSVERDRRIPRSAVVVIRYRNLVGQRYLAVTEGAGDSRPLPADGLIPLSQTRPALDLTVLFNGFKPLFAALSPQDVNKLSGEIISVLQGEGGNLESLLGHTASLTSALADRDQLVGDTIDNLNSVLGTLAARDDKLSDLVAQTQRFVSGLSADRQAIGDSLQGINDLAGATSDLLVQARQPLKQDVSSLGDLAATLDSSRNQKVLDSFLGFLPTKLERISRTATYGSWFNFYLCDVSGTVQLPTGTSLPVGGVKSQQGRCSR
ncbi:MAG: MCE family protein [Actinomycetales bacterium]